MLYAVAPIDRIDMRASRFLRVYAYQQHNAGYQGLYAAYDGWPGARPLIGSNHGGYKHLFNISLGASWTG